MSVFLRIESRSSCRNRVPNLVNGNKSKTVLSLSVSQRGLQEILLEKSLTSALILLLKKYKLSEERLNTAIVAGGTIFPVHREILFKCSTLFENLFRKTNIRLDKEAYMQIDNIDSKTMLVMLNYMYTETLSSSMARFSYGACPQTSRMRSRTNLLCLPTRCSWYEYRPGDDFLRGGRTVFATSSTRVAYSVYQVLISTRLRLSPRRSNCFRYFVNPGGLLGVPGINFDPATIFSEEVELVSLLRPLR
ncbi:unnamed protein product [Trichogramma brassicae]|uniref:BTB domain-containing protein n=1 Tax=Trichogramma brassicae TaxID=86971 RepID=A0A6H5IC50_9HYME|nr:unnamed protein product [Trichogramma brassicae]